MKIKTGRQLLEWLQQQNDETLDNKILICGEDTPYSLDIYIKELKEDIWYDGDEYSRPWSDLKSELTFKSETREEQENEAREEYGAEKVFDKGGIEITF